MIQPPLLRSAIAPGRSRFASRPQAGTTDLDLSAVDASSRYFSGWLTVTFGGTSPIRRCIEGVCRGHFLGC